MPLRRPVLRTVLLLALFTTGSVLGSGCALETEPDACAARTCDVDGDCGFGQVCSNHSCQRRHFFCATDSVSMNDRGEWMDCDVYRCNPSNGQCLRSADNSDDCRNGALWDPSGTCICPAGTPCGGSSPPPAYDRSCYTACAHDSDCASNQMCWTPPTGSARCVASDAYCDGAVSVSPHGSPGVSGDKPRDVTSCGNYGCNAATGLCLGDCTNSSQCGIGKFCSLCTIEGCPNQPQACL